MIEAQTVSVAIGGQPILADIGFRAEPGALTAVVGPNGSGKTTFLKALCGDLAYSGQITIEGREVSRMRPAEAARSRAVLPQSTNLSFPFTVREVVSLGIEGGLSGLGPAEAAKLPELALEKVDLAGFAGRLYQQLSGGEQQRVQLARVLCQVWMPLLDGRPRWLFLDEPVSSLDIRHQLAIMDIARDFAAAGGGVVAILHDLNLAAMYADRIAMLRGGRLAHFGTPQDVLRDDHLEAVFACRLRVNATPADRVPFILPQSVAP